MTDQPRATLAQLLTDALVWIAGDSAAIEITHKGETLPVHCARCDEKSKHAQDALEAAVALEAERPSEGPWFYRDREYATREEAEAAKSAADGKGADDSRDALRELFNATSQIASLVALLAHGVDWEIAPSIQGEARRVEVLMLEALRRARQVLEP